MIPDRVKMGWCPKLNFGIYVGMYKSYWRHLIYFICGITTLPHRTSTRPCSALVCFVWLLNRPRAKMFIIWLRTSSCQQLWESFDGSFFIMMYIVDFESISTFADTKHLQKINSQVIAMFCGKSTFWALTFDVLGISAWSKWTQNLQLRETLFCLDLMAGLQSFIPVYDL